MATEKSLKIMVPTIALARLLESDPQIELELKSMACEKIAQEMARKVVDRDLQGISTAIRAAVMKELEIQTKGISDKSTLVQKQVDLVRQSVERIIDEVLASRSEALVERLAKQASAAIEKKFEALHSGWRDDLVKMMDARDAELLSNVKTLARSEFLDVVSGVRNTLA